MTSFKIIFIVLIYIQFLNNFSFGEKKNFFGCLKAKPECPNTEVSFYFYTRETQQNPVKLNLSDPASVVNANFIKHRPLIVIIHGFTGDKDYSPNVYLRPAYFKRGQYNIISVDYAELAKSPCYVSAVGNVPTVANCTAHLIDFMLEREIFDIDSIHVIGFSLGAQTAGKEKYF